MRYFVVKLLSCVLQLCYGQEHVSFDASSLHPLLIEKIGNYSLELLFHTSKVQQHDNINMIMSPVTLWTVLAALREGASQDTLRQLQALLRIGRKDTPRQFRDISKQLNVNTNRIECKKMSTIIINSESLPLQDFMDNTNMYYDTEVYSLNFTDAEKMTELINRLSFVSTHGKVPNIVESSYFLDAQIILASALYFKGAWNMAFNASSTTRAPFYSSSGEKIGDVNMMYSRNTYPLSNIKKLQARVIELPYGDQNRLSMFIMLPNSGVSVENMFRKFTNVTLEELYEELRICGEVFGDDKVDCFIPRFQIDSSFELSNAFTSRMGLISLFDKKDSRLHYVARTPVYVSKVLHRVKIEVTEDGINSNTGAEHNSDTNSIGSVTFKANRPFAFFIVEKVTNSIIFGGYYQQPSLF